MFQAVGEIVDATFESDGLVLGVRGADWTVKVTVPSARAGTIRMGGSATVTFRTAADFERLCHGHPAPYEVALEGERAPASASLSRWKFLEID